MTEQPSSAQLKNAIILTVDRNYLPYALFVIDQIATLSKDRDFDFGILTLDTLGEHALLDRHRVVVRQLPRDEISSNLPHSERISIATYLRFYIPTIFSEYDRVLYLDSDLYIRRGDFSRLLKVDMGGCVLAAARDPSQFRHPGRVHPDMRKLNLGYFPYISAGVLLIDNAAFRANRIAEQALALASERPNELMAYDQTALNAVLKGRFAELPPGWNWLYGFRSLYFTEVYDPPILHFAGHRKPWNKLDGTFPTRYGDAYRNFFGSHFPEIAQAISKPLPISKKPFSHVRVLLNHINGLRRFTKALDAFDGDFDIRPNPTA